MKQRTGALRRRLEIILTREGFVVHASDITQNAPAYRTYMRNGIAWEVWGYRANRGGVRLFSFDTMAECCRNGITVHEDGGAYEVSAK